MGEARDLPLSLIKTTRPNTCSLSPFERGARMSVFKLASLGILLVASPAIAETTPIQKGHDLIVSSCSRCHSVGAAGESPNPKAPHFRDLNQRYPIDSLAEALAEGIRTGHPQMPEFVFAPDEVDSIIAYLKSIQAH